MLLMNDVMHFGGRDSKLSTQSNLITSLACIKRSNLTDNVPSEFGSSNYFTSNKSPFADSVLYILFLSTTKEMLRIATYFVITDRKSVV